MMIKRNRGIRSALLLTLLVTLPTGCRFTANRHNNVGCRAYATNQFGLAINEFQRALNADPQNADAYYNLASTYYQLGKQNENSQWVGQAEQLYRQAIANNDMHVAAHRSLAALLIESDREQHAFDLVNAWRNRYPHSAEPLIEIARLYQEYGDHRRSVDFLADALRIDSSNVRALKAMGHVRESQGQLNLALDSYQRALQLDVSQTDVAQRIGDIQNRLAAAANPNQLNR